MVQTGGPYRVVMSMSMFKSLSPEEIDENQINKQAEEALERGEITDILGNPMGKDDFVALDPKWDKGEFVTNLVLPQMKHLQGKVLTIVDASYDDKERAKYVKDLIKDVFSTQADCIFQMLVDSENNTAFIYEGTEEKPMCKNGCDGVVQGCTECPKN